MSRIVFSRIPEEELEVAKIVYVNIVIQGAYMGKNDFVPAEINEIKRDKTRKIKSIECSLLGNHSCMNFGSKNLAVFKKRNF